VSDTENFSKRRDSFLSGISVRGAVALAVLVTVCTLTLLKVDVTEPLKTIAVLISGYYFGRATIERNA
jgi:hypothetical protein